MCMLIQVDSSRHEIYNHKCLQTNLYMTKIKSYNRQILMSLSPKDTRGRFVTVDQETDITRQEKSRRWQDQIHQKINMFCFRKFLQIYREYTSSYQ